jgi:hypothetical protein
MHSDFIVYVVLHDVLLENGSPLHEPVPDASRHHRTPLERIDHEIQVGLGDATSIQTVNLENTV